MKKLVFIIIGALAFAGTLAQADSATEEAVKKAILDGNAYVKKHLKDEADTVSKDGSLEFWSSGGFLQAVYNCPLAVELPAFDAHIQLFRPLLQSTVDVLQ